MVTEKSVDLLIRQLMKHGVSVSRDSEGVIYIREGLVSYFVFAFFGIITSVLFFGGLSSLLQIIQDLFTELFDWSPFRRIGLAIAFLFMVIFTF